MVEATREREASLERLLAEAAEADASIARTLDAMAQLQALSPFQPNEQLIGERLHALEAVRASLEPRASSAHARTAGADAAAMPADGGAPVASVCAREDDGAVDALLESISVPQTFGECAPAESAAYFDAAAEIARLERALPHARRFSELGEQVRAQQAALAELLDRIDATEDALRETAGSQSPGAAKRRAAGERGWTDAEAEVARVHVVMRSSGVVASTPATEPLAEPLAEPAPASARAADGCSLCSLLVAFCAALSTPALGGPLGEPSGPLGEPSADAAALLAAFELCLRHVGLELAEFRTTVRAGSDATGDATRPADRHGIACELLAIALSRAHERERSRGIALRPALARLSPRCSPLTSP
ncbi:hypothetical protein KFE25_006134 [Diacronema lutheri]|uniref:Uncharacterized protein n=1 Tax=Diacronema lutheri TaxID=2081491 RepID=A0A8J5XSH1_DIALT|nr:hypothetical protein KFE25_006134 [Diacronema lutheri]